MNGIISRYGTFFVIPPVLAIIAIIAFTFKVTERREVTIVQQSPGIVCVYLPADMDVSDTVKVSAPETGEMKLPVISAVSEENYTKVTCKGELPGRDSMVRAYVITGRIPIVKLLINYNA